MSTTTMSVSVEGSRKRNTKSGVLSTEHTVVLRSIIQNLVVMWADEVMNSHIDNMLDLQHIMLQQAQPFYFTFAGTNERQ